MGLDYYNHNLGHLRRILRQYYYDKKRIKIAWDTLSRYERRALSFAVAGIMGWREEQRIEWGYCVNFSLMSPHLRVFLLNMAGESRMNTDGKCDDLIPSSYWTNRLFGAIIMPKPTFVISGGRHGMNEQDSGLVF